jgi:hypothetical protein
VTDSWQPLVDRLGLLAASWPCPPWSWDGRLSSVYAEFSSKRETEVLESVQHAFPNSWTPASLDTAPDALRALVARTGGLRSKQRLLGGDEVLAPNLFGLWWPWSGGSKVTLRIGIAGHDANTEPMPRVRALFGVR